MTNNLYQDAINLIDEELRAQDIDIAEARARLRLLRQTNDEVETLTLHWFEEGVITTAEFEELASADTKSQVQRCQATELG